MTPTLNPVSALLPAAGAPAKAADSAAPQPAGGGFAQELTRAREAEAPPAAPARRAAPAPATPQRAARPAADGRAPAEGAGRPPAGDGPADGPVRHDVTDPAHRAGDGEAAPKATHDDLASMIQGLLGLQAAPPAAPAPGSADASAAAGASVTTATRATGAAVDGEPGISAASLANAGPAPRVGGANQRTAADLRAGVAERATDSATDGAAAAGADRLARAAERTVALTDAAAPAADAPGAAPGATPRPAGAELVPASTGAAAASAALTATSAAAPMASTAAAAAAAPFESRLAAALGSAEFAPALGQQVRVLVQDGVQHARLHLNPAEMGPITVQIALDGSAAQVHLAAEQPVTRQALESAMPALASALREGGLTLSGGGVFEQPRDPQRDASGGAAAPGRRGDDGGADAAEPGTSLPGPAPRRLRGAVDLIA